MSLLLTLCIALANPPAAERQTVIVVVGAPGTEEYGAAFAKSAGEWKAAAAKGEAAFTLIGQDAEEKVTDRDRLQKTLTAAVSGSSPLWLVLLGHGTDDGKEARFNLRGPDVSVRELAAWLEPMKRPIAVVNCASSSAPFISALSAPNHVIVTATRSGSESNYARLGEYLAGALLDPEADIDRDGQVSLLEAFLTAANRTADFYKSESRLATEHALIDDNGDKFGSPADWFQGTRAVKRAKSGTAVDGVRAHQWHLVPAAYERALPPAVKLRRDELERKLESLREAKDRLPEVEYYARLEAILVELARLYRDAGQTPK